MASPLNRVDCDLDCGLWAKRVALLSMTFCEPMSNSSPDLAHKVETALFHQMSKIADQICNGMLINGATVLLKGCDCSGRPSEVFGFIAHVPPCRARSNWTLESGMCGCTINEHARRHAIIFVLY
jgi:hypothetical protein